MKVSFIDVKYLEVAMKKLLHKSSELLSLVSGSGLNSSPQEAKNPGIFHASTAVFHLGRSSGILQDKMGANYCSLTPLNCILKTWDRFDPQGLKKTHLILLCDTAWPQNTWRMANGGWLEGLLIIVLFYN